MSRPHLFQALIVAVLLWLPGSVAQADYTVASTFDTTAEGWTAVNDVTLSWAATGGVAGGFLAGADKATGEWWFYGAPPKFLGRKGAAYGRTLTFHLKQSDASAKVSTLPNVILASDTLTLVLKFVEEPGTDWKAYSLTLDATGGWKKATVDGPVPTEAEFRSVLGNLIKLHIRGEYSETRDSGGLDEVILTVSGEPPVHAVPVASTFDADSEGWRALGNTTGTEQGISWLAAGGNPDGCVMASDLTSDTWYFVAPEAYLGAMGAAYGSGIRFDLKQASTTSPFDGPDVILDGEALTLVYDTAANPGTVWTPYSIPLEPGGWRVGTLTGEVATEAQLRGVLSALTALRIRGEYRSGDDTAWLDNVFFGTGLPVYGDADGNGVTGAGDVTAVLRIAAGLQAAGAIPSIDVAPRPSASPNGYGDGRLDLLDALRILRYLRGLEAVWP